ncbi:MAG: 2-C-methyl-D-erythritol 2,4-cyclodiphosphate synthase [Bacillales bacterium]|jgi:2-C-methyl-D-erythritol 2,4-cyclodiphosphate synthase|nr:2-C-methyl-D-erythritol 2,4-cyclodiphosphate synthase [Bacillales bacterium]
MRIGFGKDIHLLVKDRPLYLGGIKIEYEKGLLGHSDADVLIHAIMDAILGALALGDIGELFPNTNPKYQNISSVVLLKEVYNLMLNQGYEINNLDTMIICEEPKITPYKHQIKNKLAELLKTDAKNISIKAGTNEGLGYLGEKLAIEASAYVSIKEME